MRDEIEAVRDLLAIWGRVRAAVVASGAEDWEVDRLTAVAVEKILKLKLEERR